MGVHAGPPARPPLAPSGTATQIKVHLACIHLLAGCAAFAPFHPALLLLCAVSYAFRIIAVEVGFHRYFSHHSFRTSRPFQLCLALLAMSTAQRDVLGWAAIHRKHHNHSDAPDDPHSPVHRGFFHAHIAWVWSKEHLETPMQYVPRQFLDFAELRLLNRYKALPALLYALLMYAIGEYTSLCGQTGMGWSAVLWGYLISNLFVLHMTLAINSCAHSTSWGYRRYATKDRSVNLPLLALFTAGGSFHNNHHRYPHAARAGFFWTELDPAYWAIRFFGLLGLVWDVAQVPRDVLEEGQTRQR